jgi:purine-binding chemotaxis protein CheW
MDDKQLVIFRLGQERYGIPIRQVNEIVRMQKVTHLPGTAAFIEGVTNLRGKVIPVIDFRKRFGLKAGEEDDQTRIIVVNITESPAGLIVDAVTEVLSLKEEDIEPLGAAVTGIDAKYITGIGKVGEELVILMDLDKVFSASEQEMLLEAIE